jgi:TonB family protein
MVLVSRAVVYPLILVLALCYCGFAQGRPGHPTPTQFEIGRHTFIDIGPPNDFYELLLVYPNPNGSTVERITLTPPGDACIQPAKIEVAQGVFDQPVAALLGKKDPCSIPEKELHRELKRCKKCLVFSGANVAMRFQCANQARIIRADILDRDMFDPAPNTPEHTSWTMQLLSRLDSILGPGVWERPIFPTPEETNTAVTALDSPTLAEIGSGKYDALFPGAPDKPSDLYRAAQISAPIPTVRLLDSTPVQPATFVVPLYPPLARLARIEGKVTFTVEVDRSGSPTEFAVETGHRLLRAAVEQAVAGWKFPTDASGQRVEASVEFRTNCPAKR